MADLKSDLQRTGFEWVETHISWVFLSATEVFKVKRPVDLGFLDFRRVEDRRAACVAEVELNRRLAEAVYLGVVPVTVDQSGTHAIDGSGRVVDWAVHMRRLSDDDRADVRLERGILQAKQVDALAKHLVAFHADARCDTHTSEHGTVEMIRHNVLENFEQTRSSISDYLEPDQVAEVQHWQLTALEHDDRFASRIRAGRVRDGHGDLRLEHVYFGSDDAIEIIDCIEFNDRFRFADVCADIAFLSMDLAWHGRTDLAERFLAEYARESNDYDLYGVVGFYESYRAFVRGKVACFLANDPEASTGSRERARTEARRYFMLSLAYERPPLNPPRVVAVGGLIASGKSRTASTVGQLLGAPVLSSDRIRKHALGMSPGQSLEADAWSGAYSPAQTDAVYRELVRLGEVVIGSGRAVVFDASFRTRESRAAIRDLARSHGVPFLFIECTAPHDFLRRRLAARDSGHESDARVSLLDDFERQFEPVAELPSSEHVVLDTARPLQESREWLTETLGL